MKLQKTFAQSLLSWFQKNSRDLPWRHTKNPYFIWVSEMMLQQTTVNTVIDYYQRWVKFYPTLESFAQAHEDQILKIWQGLGYYQRARNFHRAAQKVISDYQGKVPSSQKALVTLPGLGPYASAAIASIAFNEKVVVIDGNIRRIMMRILAIKDQISLQYDEPIKKKLNQWIQGCRDNGKFNEAMMEIGALICRPKNPLCLECPIRAFCASYKKSLQDQIPQRKTQTIKEVFAITAIIQNKGKVLIQKRPNKGLWANFWEFPTFSIPSTDVDMKKILKEAIKKDYQLNITVQKELIPVKHSYTKYRQILIGFQCESRLCKEYKNRNCLWVGAEALNQYVMSSGHTKILKQFLMMK